MWYGLMPIDIPVGAPRFPQGAARAASPSYRSYCARLSVPYAFQRRDLASKLPGIWRMLAGNAPEVPMDTLKSKLFAGDRKLEAALNQDSAHIVPGVQGDHVGKIQTALLQLLGPPPPNITAEELRRSLYGTMTARVPYCVSRPRIRSSTELTRRAPTTLSAG